MNRILDEITGAAGLAATVLFSPILRPRYSRWGCTETEATEPLPGDAIIPNPDAQSTRAISIDATPREVWPWLAQMGQGRGGFYSYQGLENLMGCRIHNVAHIHPELQGLKVGDEIRAGPPGYLYWRVVEVDPGKHLVLRVYDPRTAEPAPSTWVFVLKPLDDGKGTRLVVRGRGRELGLAWKLIVDPGSFVFERRMLLGIRERVERS